MHLSTRGLAAAVLFALVPAVQAQDIAPGFATVERHAMPVFAVQATLADGTYFQFDGAAFTLHAADGTLLANLGTLPGQVFPSFARLDPGETYALVGESSNGDVFAVDLAGGGFTLVANVPLNYDAVFEDAGHALLSVGTFAPRTRIERLDVATGVRDLVARVQGFQGPLALDALGRLYYVTQATVFPTPPGSLEILRWSAAQIASGAVLGEADAAVVVDGLDGGSSLAIDPPSQNLVLAELNASGAIPDRIRILSPRGEPLGEVASTSVTLGQLDVRSGSGTGELRAFQPAGSRLACVVTDFNVFAADRIVLEPARPTATLTGPGVGRGAMTLTIEGAAPDAAVAVYFGSVADLVPGELVLHGPFDFAFHTALPLAKTRRTAFLTPTDGTGTAVFQYFDPGNLHGTLVFQSLLYDADLAPVGTSAYVLN